MFHKEVARISLNHFNSLPNSKKPKPNEWTVLSTIVQEKENKFEVVSLATGSKCLGKNLLSPFGDVVNDSHAEILCRRAFLRYLYSQLQESTLFENSSNKFKLAANVKFHFFTTHVPCGDAAIFPKNEEECKEEKNCGYLLDDNQESTPKRVKLDIHRTGAKCLPDDRVNFDLKGTGFKYHVLGATRTKPGRGDTTLSVSCSDKIAKWMHVGIQGALLSLLLVEPVYLSSFTIVGNTPFHLEAFNRAIFNRIKKIDLPAPYSKRQLLIAQINELQFNYNKGPGKQASASSMIYTFGKKLEIGIEGRKQGVIKKNLLKISSRLAVCKKELFKLYLKCSQSDDSSIYSETKHSAIEYCRAWHLLRNEGFSVWTYKSLDLLKFNGKN